MQPNTDPDEAASIPRLHIEFTYRRSPEYFRSQRRPAAMGIVRRTLLFALVLIGLGVLTIALADGEGVGLVVGLGALVIGLILPLSARTAFTAEVTVPESWSAPRSYLISEKGLTSSTVFGSSHWNWAAVLRVHVRPEAYLFYRLDAPGHLFDLPREPITAVQESALRAWLADQGLLPLDQG
jgi:hypothetical protein